MAYSEITNAQVAAGASINTALMTALRDNFLAVLNREAGAPAVVGFPYNYQEFLTSGTWTKPANAEAGDKIVVEVIGAGGAGSLVRQSQDNTPAGTGGAGGGRLLVKYDISVYGATEPVAVGAGGATKTNTQPVDGNSGGNSSFGDSATDGYLIAYGGAGGIVNSSSIVVANGGGAAIRTGGNLSSFTAGDLGEFIKGGDSHENGAGGGGGQGRRAGTSSDPVTLVENPGASLYAGNGGLSAFQGVPEDGYFPGGGGGAVGKGNNGTSYTTSAGANGVVRVWCIRES